MTRLNAPAKKIAIRKQLRSFQKWETSQEACKLFASILPAFLGFLKTFYAAFLDHLTASFPAFLGFLAVFLGFLTSFLNEMLLFKTNKTVKKPANLEV